ncbi:hypothetical protein LCGC14_2089240, partial [marine sediment metagenome]
IELAINAARKSHDIFGRDLEMKKDLEGEIQVIVNKLNEDWDTVFSCFKPLMELIYEAGKEEKILATSPEQREGIVKGD